MKRRAWRCQANRLFLRRFGLDSMSQFAICRPQRGPSMSPMTLVGRSSSHFTRVTRIFALELSVPHTFRPVLDIATVDPTGYADNPALKIPILVDARGPLCCTENICREVVRRSGRGAEVVLRGDLPDRVVANAEELTLHVMSAEV